jgi:hypothetical protein
MHEDLKTLHPGGIRTLDFFSGRERDDHYDTPPEQHEINLFHSFLIMYVIP